MYGYDGSVSGSGVGNRFWAARFMHTLNCGRAFDKRIQKAYTQCELVSDTRYFTHAYQSKRSERTRALIRSPHQHISTTWPDNSLSVRFCLKYLSRFIDISLLFDVVVISVFYITFGIVPLFVISYIYCCSTSAFFFRSFRTLDSNSHEYIEMKSTSFCSKSVNHCYYVIFVCIRCRHTSFLFIYYYLFI